MPLPVKRLGVSAKQSIPTSIRYRNLTFLTSRCRNCTTGILSNGDEYYLQLNQAALPAIAPQIEGLRKLTSDSPIQQQSFCNTTKTMYDLTNFTRDDMYKCAIALRNMNSGCKSMEETANRMISYLYDNLLDGKTGKRACALVRFFKTHTYGELNEELQKAATEILRGRWANPSTKCLTLLATAGDELHWNSRYASSGHKAIPLIDRGFVERVPMISQLIQQFGLEIENVIEPDPELLADLESHTFNVFYIPEALGSPYIPAQKDFVIPYKIKSVMGFGGMLPSGNLFAILLFAKVLIPENTAKDLFKWISAYARIPAAEFDQGVIFKPM